MLKIAATSLVDRYETNLYLLDLLDSENNIVAAGDERIGNLQKVGIDVAVWPSGNHKNCRTLSDTER